MQIIEGPENQEVILINKADVCLNSSLTTYAKSCTGSGMDNDSFLQHNLTNITVCTMSVSV